MVLLIRDWKKNNISMTGGIRMSLGHQIKVINQSGDNNLCKYG